MPSPIPIRRPWNCNCSINSEAIAERFQKGRETESFPPLFLVILDKVPIELKSFGFFPYKKILFAEL